MIKQISMYLLRVKKKWVDVAIKETNIPTGMSRIRGRLKYFKKSSNLEALFSNTRAYNSLTGWCYLTETTTSQTQKGFIQWRKLSVVFKFLALFNLLFPTVLEKPEWTDKAHQFT